MAEFYSRSNLPVTIAQPKCEKIVPTYGKEIDKDGKVHIVETGKTNLYEKIQASKEDTLVYNILDRFNAGDVSVLQKNKGYYGDFTDMPKTLAEAQQSLITAENYFNSLPLDVRKEFNHSFSEFLSSASAGKLAERHAYFKPPKEVEQAINQAQNQQNLEQQVQQTVVQTPQVQQTVVQTPQIVTGGSNE